MIVGVTGPLGAGKDTVAEYVAAKLGAQHVSGGDVLREMLRTLGLEPKKSALGDFGTFLRTHYGEDVITNMVESRGGDAKHLVVSGFRSPVEALHRKKTGLLVYIDAPLELRYARIGSRQRLADSMHIEDLQKLDRQEHQSTKPMAENLDAVRELADVIIVNDGSLEELQAKLDKLIAERINQANQ